MDKPRKLILINLLPSLKATVDVGSVLAPWVSHRRLPYPYRMTMVVTRRCNGRCQMCHMWQQTDARQLSLEQMEGIFQHNNFWFLRSLVLTGGEPTLREDLPQLLGIVAQGCPSLEHVYLSTNGLNSRRILDIVGRMLPLMESQMPSVKLFQVQVSLDGIGHTHDVIRGIRGAFSRVQRTLDGLEELREHFPQLSLRLSTVVVPQNLTEMPTLRRFAAERRIPIHFSPLVSSGMYYDNLDMDTELFFPSNDGNEAVIQLLDSLARSDTSSLQFQYRNIVQMLQGAPRNRKCMMGLYEFVLEYDGQVYACVNCEDFAFGNLLEAPFNEIWFGAQATQARQQVQQSCCPTCPSLCHAPAVNAKELLQLKWRSCERRLRRMLGNTRQMMKREKDD